MGRDAVRPVCQRGSCGVPFVDYRAHRGGILLMQAVLLLRQDWKLSGRWLSHDLVTVLIMVDCATLLVLLRQRTLPALRQTFEGTWIWRSRGLWLHRLEHARPLLSKLLFFVLLLVWALWLKYIERLLVDVGRTLLLLHCCRLLSVLHTSAPSSEFKANLIWNFDCHRYLVGSGHIWALCTDLRRQSWHSGCSFDRWLSLIHLERWHCHIMLVLLADLKGLFEDVLVRNDAHVRVITILLLLLNNHLLSLVYSHFLDYVGKQLDCLVGWEHFCVYMFDALSSITLHHSVSPKI